MTMRPQLPVPEPDLRALLDAFRTEIFAGLNCHQWGIVQAFNAAENTVTVKIAVLRQIPQVVNGQAAYVAKPYPLLLNVPVMIPAGGAGYLTFPITAGDVCLVLFNDRDFDQFWETGNVVEPNSSRMHDLSDGLAIVGFRTKAKPLTPYDEAQVVLALATTKLVLGDKVGLENSAISLLTVLTNLITTLKAWVDTAGNTPNATTLTKLTNNQTDITSLLQ